MNDSEILDCNEKSNDLHSEEASNDDASSSDSNSASGSSSSDDSSSSGSSSDSSGSSNDSTSANDDQPFIDPSSINHINDSHGLESDRDGADEPDDKQIGRAGEAMSGSMQGIVDGLMEWGDQYDSTDDISLPSGMAVSMMLEEAGVVAKPSLSDAAIDPDLLG